MNDGSKTGGTYAGHQDNRGVYLEVWVIDLMDGDLPAALLFRQLLWWHQPSRDGLPRIRYERFGHRWLLRADDGWWDECRLTLKQVRRVRSKLLALGLIEHRRFKLNGAPTSAWRPIMEAIQAARNPISPKPELPSAGQFHGSDPQGAVPSDPQGAVPIEGEVKDRSRDVTPSAPSEPIEHLPNPLFVTATQLARGEWDRRDVKPVGGKFVAFRTRILEQLQAGRDPTDLARVLPTMEVFTRDAFDFCMRDRTRRSPDPMLTEALSYLNNHPDPHGEIPCNPSN